MQDKEKFNYDKWYHRLIAYHIYPLSFKDSDGDGKGDLKGIIEKLDYLKELGMGAIWISPIFESPMEDLGYDISDYYKIDKTFGNLEIFDELISQSHKRGIRVIIDYVINHTSSKHSWFLESKSSKDDPKRDWYIWRDPNPDGSPPNNWRSVFGGSAWELDKKTGQYYFHSFLKSQPDLNWRHADVRHEMIKIAEFWFNRGVDGLRVDAIEHLIEDSYLRDDPYNPDYIPGLHDPYSAIKHVFSKGQADLKYCINALCELAQKKDKFIVSEIYAGIPEMMDMYRACMQKNHAPFNFNLMTTPWIASEYRKFIDDFEKALEPGDWPNYVFGNHDRSRLATRMGEDKLRAIATILLTLRGMPFIYYGDEIGMTNAKITGKNITDEFSRQVKDPKFARDPERSPMQWNKEKYAGFSNKKPWIPLSDEYQEKNVETELENPRSLLNLYKKIINFRNQSEALMIGSYQSLDTKSKDIFSYVREYEGEKILTMINFSEKTVEESLPFQSAKIVCGSNLDRAEGEKVSGDILFRPFEAYIFEI